VGEPKKWGYMRERTEACVCLYVIISMSKIHSANVNLIKTI